MITKTCVLPLLSWIGDWGAIQVKRYYWLVVAEVYGEVSVERQTNRCTCDWLESSIRVITK